MEPEDGGSDPEVKKTRTGFSPRNLFASPRRGSQDTHPELQWTDSCAVNTAKVSPGLPQDPEWSAFRLSVSKAIQTTQFDVIVGTLITFNVVLVVYETDLHAEGAEFPPWLRWTLRSFLLAYALELGAKIYVGRRVFFTEVWHVLDCFIIGVDLICEVIG
eukprot:CAMPEP_0168469034 /NCGR_PEP_ID=MMETSP0228-20121227/58009_1 /TAXON_ID=133427 /ORGANISM="Protoceratium reticulatum, Strain CCCM 535 (=CCMP 1889)" /LENGTH=159 /DNA_ID=CAMNT_0008484801 /DNA_START=26 /DNA_END=501 /DNA_ORIENTATION=+